MAADGRQTTLYKAQITKEPLIKSRLPLFSRWRSPSAVMRSAPESPQRSCGGYISGRLDDHRACGGQRFLHNLTGKNLNLNHAHCNRETKKMLNSCRTTARHE